MAFRILDASAFYAGVPFGSTEKYYTSTQIFDEISHIKEKHGAIDVLLSTGRLDVRQASQESCNVVKKASVESGDAQTLSESDVSLLALGYEMKGEHCNWGIMHINMARLKALVQYGSSKRE